MRKAILASSAAVAFMALAACDGQAPPPQGGGDMLGGMAGKVVQVQRD